MRPFRPEASTTSRPAAIAYAVTATLVTLFCVGLTVSSVVDPTGWERPARYWFWLLSLLLVPISVLRWRRVRRLTS